ncbi:urease accessory protein UreD [Nocardioides nitrophenolicus]|uniref:urease accessory protein UreD n=1 Tax=Nocardioides nitrophenolicus TaxID=60489 RepID=UPI00195FC22D|nr:urease accessory protein UreD [Nocardioides nitrophenolicus]MBM7520412.1 urease accessory protein [Nocardioides nitrophenolicus]
MLTSTERTARTRVRVSRTDTGRCRVRSTVTLSDPTASSLRPLLVHHDATSARVSLVPEGALLLAGDRVEVDLAVDAGARLDVIEPGGTVAFDMRGGRAAWDVRIALGRGAVLTWAGEPFVVAAGAAVARSLRVRLRDGAVLALRESLVLGRHGEEPGRVHQATEVVTGAGPVLVEDLTFDALTAPALLGGHRVMSSVLLVGAPPSAPAGPDRFDLEGGGTLWRRLGVQAHESDLGPTWRAVRESIGSEAG